MILFVSLVFGTILCLAALVVWTHNLIRACDNDDVNLFVSSLLFISLLGTAISVNSFHILNLYVPKPVQQETIEVEEDTQPKVEEDLVV